MLAEFLTDFADTGQAALTESSDQGLQSLPMLSNMICLECLFKPTVSNLPNRYGLLTDFADSDRAALVESTDRGLQCLSIY